jgi:single-strand DNA-binding protein
MNEPYVTFQGWVGGDVVYRETREGNVANFRVGSTPRLRKRNGDWVDGLTSWFSVSAWRGLAENVRDSVRKGDPVIVHGRLRTDVWKREDGELSTTYVVEAQFVGHDLSRGTSAFLRTVKPDRAEPDEETDHELKAFLHAQTDDLPQLDSSGNERNRTGRDDAA